MTDHRDLMTLAWLLATLLAIGWAIGPVPLRLYAITLTLAGVAETILYVRTRIDRKTWNRWVTRTLMRLGLLKVPYGDLQAAQGRADGGGTDIRRVDPITFGLLFSGVLLALAAIALAPIDAGLSLVATGGALLAWTASIHSYLRPDR